MDTRWFCCETTTFRRRRASAAKNTTRRTQLAPRTRPFGRGVAHRPHAREDAARGARRQAPAQQRCHRVARAGRGLRHAGALHALGCGAVGSPERSETGLSRASSWRGERGGGGRAGGGRRPGPWPRGATCRTPRARGRPRRAGEPESMLAPCGGLGGFATGVSHTEVMSILVSVALFYTTTNTLLWDLPGDVLAAPASALCGWIGVNSLFLTHTHTACGHLLRSHADKVGLTCRHSSPEVACSCSDMVNVFCYCACCRSGLVWQP